MFIFDALKCFLFLYVDIVVLMQIDFINEYLGRNVRERKCRLSDEGVKGKERLSVSFPSPLKKGTPLYFLLKRQIRQ